VLLSRHLSRCVRHDKYAKFATSRHTVFERQSLQNSAGEILCLPKLGTLNLRGLTTTLYLSLCSLANSQPPALIAGRPCTETAPVFPFGHDGLGPEAENCARVRTRDGWGIPLLGSPQTLYLARVTERSTGEQRALL